MILFNNNDHYFNKLNLVPIANTALLQVWVQGKKVGGEWQFDDGTQIPDFCPIGMTNGAGEIHLRASREGGSTSFDCLDDPKINEHHYSCEYRRLLYFNN